MKTKKQNKLKETISHLKSICSDSKLADKLVKDLVSQAKQEAIKPTLVHVENDVVAEIKESAYTISKTKEDIIVFHVNGMDVVIKPWLVNTHNAYSLLLDLKDNYDELDEEQKAGYDSLLFSACIVPQITLFAFSSPELLFKLTSLINEHFEELRIKVEEELQPEDYAANEKFREQVEFFEGGEK